MVAAVTLLTIIGSIVMVCKAGGRMFPATPLAAFVGVYLLLHLPIAALHLHDAPRFSLLVALGLASVALGGMVAANWNYRLRLPGRMLRMEHGTRRLDFFFWCSLVLSVAAGMLYFRGLPPIVHGLGSLLSGKSLSMVQFMLSTSRMELTKSYYFGGAYRGQGVLKTINQVSWSFTSVLSIVTAMRQGQRKKWVRCALVLLTGAFFLYGSGERTPLLWLGVMVIFAWTYSRGGPWRNLAIGAISLAMCLFVTTIAMPRYSLHGNVVKNLLESVGRRLFLGNGAATYELYRLVAHGQLRFSLGAEHMRRLANALPGVNTRPLAYDLYLMMPGASAGKTVYESTSYLGVQYLDFGFIGVAVISFAIGGALQLLHYSLMVINSPVRLATLSTIAGIAASSVIGGTIDAVIRASLLVFLVVALLTITEIMYHSVATGVAVKSWRSGDRRALKNPTIFR